jgi:hypothetical protein
MTKRIGRVTADLSISAEGYSDGLNQTEERLFGDDSTGRQKRRGRNASRCCPSIGSPPP